MIKIKIINLLLLSALLFNLSCDDKQETVYNIIFNVAEIDFGRIEAQTETDTIITITNSTESSGTFVGFLKILDIEAVSIDHSENITIEKGETVSIVLTFVPTSYKEYNGKFTVIDEDRNQDYLFELPLRGVGAAPVDFTLNTNDLQFNLVQPGTHKELQLIIENSSFSGFDLEISLSGISGDFSLPDDISEFIIAIGESVVIPVRYTPTVFNSESTLFIKHNSSLKVNPLTVILTGTLDAFDTLYNLVKNGWEEFESGNYDEALTSFQDILKTLNSSVLYDSLQAEVLNGSGWSNAFLRDYSAASTDFNEVQNYYSTISASTKLDAIAGLVIVENIRGKYTVVIDLATELLSTDPEYVFSHNTSINYNDIRLARAQAYFNSGDFINCALDLDILDADNKPHSSNPTELLQFLQTISAELQ